MVGFTLRNTLSEFGTVARGVCHVDEEGYLKDITELKAIEREGTHITNVDEEGHETRLSGGEVVSMNMWGFTPQVFPILHKHFQDFLKNHGQELKSECFIPSTVNELLMSKQARSKCFALAIPGSESPTAKIIRAWSITSWSLSRAVLIREGSGDEPGMHCGRHSPTISDPRRVSERHTLRKRAYQRHLSRCHA